VFVDCAEEQEGLLRQNQLSGKDSGEVYTRQRCALSERLSRSESDEKLYA
jgi:hypothetical protein